MTQVRTKEILRDDQTHSSSRTHHCKIRSTWKQLPSHVDGTFDFVEPVFPENVIRDSQVEVQTYLLSNPHEIISLVARYCVISKLNATGDA